MAKKKKLQADIKGYEKVLALFIKNNEAKNKKKKRKTIADVKCYAIKWISLITGKTGHGTTLFTQCDVVAICKHENSSWLNEIDHNTMSDLELKMGIL